MLICVTVAVLFAVAAGVPVTFDNTVPRLDNKGVIMDAHDGRVVRFDPTGPFYLYAVQYGLCNEPKPQGCDSTPDSCGFRHDHNITIWKSDTMASGTWEYLGSAIAVADRPVGTVFRPDCVFNRNTNQYVLWWNWVAGNGTYMGYAAATSPTPTGPFTLKRSSTNLTRNNATWHAGDGHLFVDDDGTAYFIYGAQYYMGLEQLTPDYLDSTGKASPLFDDFFVESPFMLKRKGIYYTFYGHCCCFCFQGSGIIVHTATSPLGPYTRQVGGDLACIATNATYPPSPMTPTPGQGCLYPNTDLVSTTRAQQNYIVEKIGADGDGYIWVGDRWSQAPDGLKGHDPTFQAPLVFDVNGVVHPVRWVDSFTIDV
eukprot:PhF_6_TR12277/c0_g1_i2/m.19474